MHGAGNSFGILENLHNELASADLNALARRLCSPETGPGADGMIVVTPGPADADFSMLFYNSDGTLGEMCGNGARCIARYGVEHALSPDPEHIRFLATAGLITGRRITEEQYEVRLNNPSVIDLARTAKADGEPVTCAYVELGDPGIPHAVTEVSLSVLDYLNDPKVKNVLRERGRQLRHCPVFPKGANVTFFAKTGEAEVKAITFERGVEEFTLACGTGCGATAVSLMLRGLIPGSTLTIHMPGGNLSVRVNRDGDIIRDIFLTGPTAMVETGEFDR